MSNFYLRTHPEIQFAIRLTLNIAAIVLTGGIFHLAYYAFMLINAYIGFMTGQRIIKQPLELDPFANIPCLKPSFF